MVIVGTFVSNANHQNCNDMAAIFVYLLLPVAGLIIVWLRKDWITKIPLCIDGFYLPIPFKTFGKEKLLLNWAQKRLPTQWSTKSNTLTDGISDFWKDGSLLCTLINSAVPGACPNPYRHWRKPPEHAQEVAFKYLGVVPIFNNSDLNSSASPYIDAKLLKYLNLLRKSIYDLEQERSVTSPTSAEYIPRGMGLYTAEQFKPSEFFIYSIYENDNFLNIEILIFGPYCSCIKTTVSDYMMEKSSRDGTSVAKNINVEIEVEKDRVRICYSTNYIGIHEIFLSCHQKSIRGSPFYINVEKYERNSFMKEKPLKRFKTTTEKIVECNQNYIESKTDCNKNIEIDEEKEKCISPNSDEGENNSQIVSLQKASTIYKENISNETQKDDKIRVSDNKVATKNINQEGEIMEISKYLKNLSNTHEKEVNLSKNISTNIAKENYSDFQKLVDNSFRKSCRITRMHPRLGQNKIAQFSYASPVCSDHIVPEDYRKLSLDSKRKMFAQNKSVAIDSGDVPIDSQFSVEENKTEELKEESTKNIIEKDGLCSSLDELKKARDKTKQSSLENVKEKRVFWESAFNESKHKIPPTLMGDAESLNTFDKNLSRDLERNKKYVKSKRRVSQSLNDLRATFLKKVLRPFKSLDDNLDVCCKTTLEDRTKLYFQNVRFVTGEKIYQGTEANKILSKKYGKKEKLSDDFTSCEAKLQNSSWSVTTKKSFKDAVAYFRNLEVGKIKPTVPNKPKNINKLNNVVLKYSRRAFNDINKEADTGSQIGLRNIQMGDGVKWRKPINNFFDVLY